jgi:multiple sugar transport system permease protein
MRLRGPLVALSTGLGLVLVLTPYIWIVLTSFKTRVDAFAIPPKIVFSPTLSNYRLAFVDGDFTRNLVNSVIVATASTAVALIAGVPAAYSLTRFRMRGNTAFLFFLLAARLFPALVLSVPLFVFFTKQGMTNSFLPVVLAHITFQLPFVVWMMRGFFAGVPTAIDEAAIIDGCGALGAFVRTVLPLTLGGLAATAIFCVINSWNEFLFALVLTSRDTATVPVAIPGLLSPIGTQWGEIAAVGTVATIPVLIFALLAQRYIVRGMTGGALGGE